MEKSQQGSPLRHARQSSTHLLFRRALFSAIAFALVVALRDVWEMAFLGVVIAVLWSFPVGLLSRVMPRGVATLVSLLAFFALAGTITPLLVAPLIQEARQAEEKLPDALNRAKDWLKHQNGSGNSVKPVEKLADGMEKKTQKIEQGIMDGIGPALLKATSFGSSAAFIFVIALFFVFEPNTYRKYIRSAVPPAYEKEYDELWVRLGVGLRKWVGGILVSMTIMGVFTAVGLKLVGLDNWLLLGALVFVGTFVPYVGALATAVPGLLMALAVSPEKFTLAALVYFGVHVVEGYIVDPLVMRRVVTIQPAVLLAWQVIMGLALGIFGFVIATPLYVCLKTAFDYLYVERGLGKHAYPPQDSEKKAS
jgi:predicted PurR-regulated permease PerM